LYFLPDPHGHNALREVPAHVLSSCGSTAGVRLGDIDTTRGAAGSAKANSPDPGPDSIEIGSA
jgi:hypothetical protein